MEIPKPRGRGIPSWRTGIRHIVMATHDKDIVNKMKKRVITLKEGRLISDIEKGKYNNETI